MFKINKNNAKGQICMSIGILYKVIIFYIFLVAAYRPELSSEPQGDAPLRLLSLIGDWRGGELTLQLMQNGRFQILQRGVQFKLEQKRAAQDKKSTNSKKTDTEIERVETESVREEQLVKERGYWWVERSSLSSTLCLTTGLRVTCYPISLEHDHFHTNQDLSRKDLSRKDLSQLKQFEIKLSHLWITLQKLTTQ